MDAHEFRAALANLLLNGPSDDSPNLLDVIANVRWPSVSVTAGRVMTVTLDNRATFDVTIVQTNEGR
jgi:hypothetical protein